MFVPNYKFGELRISILVHELFYFDTESYSTGDELDNLVDMYIITSHPYLVNESTIIATAKNLPNYSKLKTFFCCLTPKKIKKTFEYTAQYARTPASTILKKHYKSSFPALSVPIRDQPVGTNAVHSKTPAINNGSASNQIFVCTKTLPTNVYGMKLGNNFIATLSDNIWKRGAMSKIISDKDELQISNKVK